MKNGFLFLLAIVSFSAAAQTYTVGTQTITYTDAARGNRAVGVEFRYPGTNGAVANGQFPFVIFAHGFAMDAVPYYPYADSLAKQGYIVGLLTTETSLLPAPSHPDFAKDLIFIHDKVISESNANVSSPFYQKVIPKGALGGHSMGGGSTVLSAQYGNPATCYFTFAAAVTNPSSTAAAPSMTKPYLSFAGSRDCIAPIATHQQLMYDASGSPCKFLINITNALHCQFGNGNAQCNLGEGLSFCASSPLSRADQINKTLLFLVPYLDYYLKGDCSAWTLFENRYAANTGDAMQRNCTNLIPSNPSIGGNNSFCNGSSTTLAAQPASFNYVWSDNSTADTLSVSTAGTYSLVVGNGVCALPSVSVSVTENFPPATPSAITASDTVCSSIANISIFVMNDANATSYNWTLPSGWSITSGSSSNAIEVTSSVSGGNVSVIAENNCGTSSAVQKNILVVPSNLGTLGAISGDTLFCEGETAHYSITPVSGADSYVWTYPAGWSVAGGNGSDTILALVSAGSGTVSVQAQNTCGQGMPSMLNVEVNAPPALVGEITGPDTICEGNGSGTNYSLSVVPLDADNYHWTIPGGWSFVGSDNSPAPVVNVNSSGTITISASNNCGSSDTLSLNVEIIDTPQTQITVGGNILTALPAGAGFTFIWYKDGQLISGSNGSTYTPSENGNYSTIITNINGCSGISQAISFVYIGIEDLIEEASFNVYPNPSIAGSLKFQVNKDLIEAEVKVVDMEGRVVMRSEVKNESSEMNISELSAGVYIVHLELNGQELRRRLVIL